MRYAKLRRNPDDISLFKQLLDQDREHLVFETQGLFQARVADCFIGDLICRHGTQLNDFRAGTHKQFRINFDDGSFQLQHLQGFAFSDSRPCFFVVDPTQEIGILDIGAVVVRATVPDKFADT
ncbi:hypothetical protein ASF71_19435 [Deinococcus sp. Leaf326]|nr:hypothetical protein ASF71_19435 [Deinococcus sp. Leaf326]